MQWQKPLKVNYEVVMVTTIECGWYPYW